MPDLMGALLAFPTVIFTALMALVLLYWLFVIFGALDVDAFSAKGGVLDAAVAKGGAFDAMAAKGGALDAMAAKGGALDAIAAKGEVADGLLDAATAKGGLIDGSADAMADGAEGASGLLHALNLRRAPVTVTFSLIVFFGWIASYLGMAYLAPLLAPVLPAWLLGTLALAGAVAVALPVTSLATRPLEPVFKQRPGKTRRDFVGSVCRIQTGRVDDRLGQATLEDGGAGLIIQVRGTAGTLARGQQALIIDYDREREAYIVEAYDAMFEAETDAEAAEAAAAEQAGKQSRH